MWNIIDWQGPKDASGLLTWYVTGKWSSMNNVSEVFWGAADFTQGISPTKNDLDWKH